MIADVFRIEELAARRVSFRQMQSLKQMSCAEESGIADQRNVLTIEAFAGIRHYNEISQQLFCRVQEDQRTHAEKPHASELFCFKIRESTWVDLGDDKNQSKHQLQRDARK